MTTFVEQCLAGEVDPDDIDDFVEAWHGGAGDGQELHEFLGLQWAEYALWAEEHRNIYPILAARRFGLPPERTALGARLFALAGHPGTSAEVAELVEELRNVPDPRG